MDKELISGYLDSCLRACHNAGEKCFGEDNFRLIIICQVDEGCQSVGNDHPARSIPMLLATLESLGEGVDNFKIKVVELRKPKRNED